MYRDAILKLNYYKSQIMQELTKKGIYPDDITVQMYLKDINERLALYQNVPVSPGMPFDTEGFKKDISLIIEDLKILYNIIYELTVKEYIELEEYAKCHLNELNLLAEKYFYKSKFEIGSTSLGKTIFFQTNGFNINTENSLIKINLGTVVVKESSKIACLFDGTDIEDKDVIFSFDDQNCSPYSYNKDFLKIPGELKYGTFKHTLDNDIIINSSFSLNISDFTPDPNHFYLIFGGKNKINNYSKVISENLIEKQLGTACTFTNPGFVEFYIYDGSSITFDFSKQPINKNFSGTQIKSLNKRQRIVIEFDADFSFDFITDGTVYAIKQIGTVFDNKLYCPIATNAKDFLIEDFMDGKEKMCNVIVTIKNNIDKVLNINAIAIKELSAIEELNY